MKLRRLLLSIFILLCAWFVVHIIYITIDGLHQTTKRADIAVVLGNKVNPDGTLSDRLKARLDRSAELYHEGMVKRLLVSGGLGKEGYYEGDKMKEYLTGKCGIPDSLVIVDNKGDNTLATVKNSLALRPVLGFRSVIVVSQFHHVSRTKMLYKKEGFNEISSASPHYFEWRDVYSLVREFFAYYKERIQ